VVDEHGTYYKEFPIARYRCYAKGKRKIPHSTFSLLPHQLIPYTRYSIPFIMKILEELSLPDSAIDAAIDYVAGLGKDDILSISAIKIRILKGLGIEAIERYRYQDITKIFMMSLMFLLSGRGSGYSWSLQRGFAVRRLIVRLGGPVGSPMISTYRVAVIIIMPCFYLAHPLSLGFKIGQTGLSGNSLS